MQFCPSHWNALRSAIDDRGMRHLVAMDGTTVGMQMIDQLERGDRGESQTETPTNFNPLMGAYYAVINNLADIARNNGRPDAALYILVGDCCPVCFVNDQHAAACDDPECAFTYDDWLGYAADDALQRAKDLALIETP